MKDKNINPFALVSYNGPAYFCDREVETKSLISNIKSGLHTSLFAIRRLGKTSLIKHCFYKLSKQKDYLCLYIDIFQTQNIQEFNNLLATTIYQQLYPKPRWLQVIKKFVSALRPVISIDELSGLPQLSIDFKLPKQYEKTIPTLFQFLEKQPYKTVIAIDEFQQILKYPETNVEAILRTSIQHLKNVIFVFSGSNQAMMFQIFQTTKRPFYASCSSLFLDKIPISIYAAYIQKHFNDNNKPLPDECIYFILNWTCVHTFYTQYFCNYVYNHYESTIDIHKIKKMAYTILLQEQGNYFQIRELLTKPQYKLLTAIAKEERVFNKYKFSFLQQYTLGAASSVDRGIQALIQHDLIYFQSTKDQAYYEVYDKFLMRWLQRL